MVDDPPEGDLLAENAAQGRLGVRADLRTAGEELGEGELASSLALAGAVGAFTGQLRRA